MLPSAFDLLPVLVAAPHLAVFLDFDGTLAPIEAHPDRVWLDAETRASVTRLATVADVAVISGRHLDDLIPRVGIPGIAYGGSHGLELQRPDGRRSDFGDPHTFDDDVRAATAMLEAHRGQHPGTMVERKPFSVAIHYPHAEPTREAHFRAGVRALAERVPRLEVLAGKHVLEFRPRSGWTKGDIVRLLLRAHADGAVGIAMGWALLK